MTPECINTLRGIATRSSFRNGCLIKFRRQAYMYLGFLASDVGMLIQLGFHMPQA